MAGTCGNLACSCYNKGAHPAYDMAFVVMCMHTMTLQWCAPCVVASVQRSGAVL